MMTESWRVLEYRHAIETLMAIADDEGGVMSSYCTYHNVRTFCNRVEDLQSAGLVMSVRSKRYNSRRLFLTPLGKDVAEGLRGVIEAMNGHDRAIAQMEEGIAEKRGVCADCDNMSVEDGVPICKGHGPVDYPNTSSCGEWRPKRGKCVDCRFYGCDEDLGPCCRLGGRFRLVAFPYGPGCESYEERRCRT